MHLGLVLGVELDLDEALLEEIIEFVAAVLLLPLLVYFLELDHHLALLRRRIIHVWVEEATNLLVVILQALQNQQLRYNEEDLRVSLLQLLRKLPVLLARRLDHLAEVQQLIECFTVQEVGQPLTPAVLEFNQNFNQLHVVL